jgi:apolipoprotein N-acyltransferase
VTPGATWRPGIAVLGVAATVAGVGAGPLAFALTPASPAVRQATVAMVQPGMISNSTLRAHATQALTAELSQGGTLSGVRPDLIVWGESSISVDLTLPGSRAQLLQLEQLAARDGADILVSQDATPPGKGHEKWAVLVSPSGIQGIYIKTRLVPFGEYIPFRQQLGWLTKISKAAASNMTPGTGAHLLQATDRQGRPLPIGVLVCFESAFPDMSRVDTDQGAQLIVYQSATSTFQGTWGPDQHASLGAVRAAETGRPVVQAAAGCWPGWGSPRAAWSPSGSACPRPRLGPSTTVLVTTFRGQHWPSWFSPHWSCLRIHAVFLAEVLAPREGMRHNM